ncbi:MAG: ATPase, T2SS/T4P/T4SS family, partial [Proteobacteria bacterium]|nr:ATPase, T2SS/T4P/T4SS family [Pseudomonadota bacterium]
PQDGRISIKVAGKDIDVRLSVLPTAHGERIVMRLLDKSSGAKRLDQVGLDPEIYQQWIQLIEQNHGIILVTGPTGSGKTSLLYASLMHINTTDINILTIEDPVEYQLAGVGQTQVQEKVGMTFAEGLRSILRQDPDVIMIGEIRDGTTAGIAIQSSMTGHLVLSTVHTNDTASTVTRFMDFHIQPFQITSAVIGIIATRLLRKLCLQCREAYVPTDRELSLMDMTRQQLGDRKIYKSGGGCERCTGIGYKDRMGVYELLVFNDAIREVIARSQDGKIIKKVAIDQGMVTLRTASIKKVLAGVTSLEEAIQNTQGDDFDDAK